MPWARISDDLYDHPKVERLPSRIRLASVGLWTLCLSWSNRFLTDGLIPADRVKKFGGRDYHLEALMAAGLADPTTDGSMQIHDFAAFSKTRAQVLAERKAAADRMNRKRRPDSPRDADEPPAKPARRPRKSPPSGDSFAGSSAEHDEDGSREVRPNTKSGSREVREVFADPPARESRPGPARPVPSESRISAAASDPGSRRAPARGSSGMTRLADVLPSALSGGALRANEGRNER